MYPCQSQSPNSSHHQAHHHAAFPAWLGCISNSNPTQGGPWKSLADDTGTLEANNSSLGDSYRTEPISLSEPLEREKRISRCLETYQGGKWANAKGEAPGTCMLQSGSGFDVSTMPRPVCACISKVTSGAPHLKVGGSVGVNTATPPYALSPPPSCGLMCHQRSDFLRWVMVRAWILKITDGAWVHETCHLNSPVRVWINYKRTARVLYSGVRTLS